MLKMYSGLNVAIVIREMERCFSSFPLREKDEKDVEEINSLFEEAIYFIKRYASNRIENNIKPIKNDTIDDVDALFERELFSN